MGTDVEQATAPDATELSTPPQPPALVSKDTYLGPDSRFKIGNPGRPKHKGKAAQLRKALLGAVTADDVREIVAALLIHAKRGDVRCARLLFDELLGKPHESITLDGIEPKVVRVTFVKGSPPLGFAGEMARLEAGSTAAELPPPNTEVN